MRSVLDGDLSVLDAPCVRVYCCTILDRQPFSFFQYGNECKFHYVDGKLCESQPPCAISQSAVQKRSATVTVEWFNKQAKRSYVKRSVLSLTHLNSAGIKPDYSDCQSTSNNNGSASDPKGLPSTEQLNSMYNKLGEEVSVYRIYGISFV